MEEHPPPKGPHTTDNNVATADETGAEEGRALDSATTNHRARHETLWSRVKEGRSFVDDDFRISPWLFASDPHGTQIANLICALDPTCQLFVAKATEGNKYGTSAERVVSVSLMI